MTATNHTQDIIPRLGFASSKVFIIIILLVGHLSLLKLDDSNQYEVVEFYAGAARLARIAKSFGVNAAAMDILFDPDSDNVKRNNAMDMNTSAGFLLLS